MAGVARLCLKCGRRYHPGHPTYCDEHKPAQRSYKKGPRPTYKETQRRRRAVEDHLKQFGPVCPGYGRDPHQVDASTLTADHIIPRSVGGEEGPLRVLCRSCNSRRGNRAP